jgi:hypothetical protein
MEDDKSHYMEFLDSMKSQVEKYELSNVFDLEWFTDVETHLDLWDWSSPLTMDHRTFFISYIQSLDSERDLVDDLGAVIALLRESDKPAIAKKRLRSLGGDTANAIGALFELLAISPLILPPNECIEIEPRIGTSQKKSEVLAKVAGQDIYLEATIFTKVDPSYQWQEARSFNPEEQLQIEGSAIKNKVLDKAQQYQYADKPVVLFIAEGLVTTGLTLGRDSRQWAMSQLGKGAVGISAIGFADNIFCDSVDFRINPCNSHPISEDVVHEIARLNSMGWRIKR